jgi:hypothetical protein
VGSFVELFGGDPPREVSLFVSLLVSVFVLPCEDDSF